MSDVSSTGDTPEPGPRFAREAADLISAGDTAGALALALEGAGRYPWYPTGLLILGQCHAASGNIPEALTALREVQRLLPDAPVVREMLAGLEARLNQPPQEAPPELPGVTAGEGRGPDVDMEALAERLRDVSRIASPEQSQTGSEELQEPEAPPQSGASPLLVSVTLAEIYVQQGQFQEAIHAYRALIERHPEEEEKHTRRIAEIEELLRKEDS